MDKYNNDLFTDTIKNLLIKLNFLTLSSSTFKIVKNDNPIYLNFINYINGDCCYIYIPNYSSKKYYTEKEIIKYLKEEFKYELRKLKIDKLLLSL